MGKPESIVENYLIEQAAKHGFFYRKMTAPGSNGFPDRLIIGYGITAFIECKASGKKPRKLQEITIDEMKKKGAFVFVADTKERVDEILSLLLRLQRTNFHKNYQKSTVKFLKENTKC